MRFLNPVARSRNHRVVSHILGTDGVTALCVQRYGEKRWPRVWAGDWETGEQPSSLNSDGLICSSCLKKQKRLDNPLPKSIKKKSLQEVREELEKRRLSRWNEMTQEWLDK